MIPEAVKVHKAGISGTTLLSNYNEMNIGLCSESVLYENIKTS